jgi:hypothetical protein
MKDGEAGSRLRAMGAGGRIAVFLVGLVVVFAAAAGIGSLVDPADTDAGATHGDGGHGAGDGTMKEEEMHGHGADQETAEEQAGLAIAEDGYSLRLAPTSIARGEERELRFEIVDGSGETVDDFDELHERRMHLIVVRRDGTRFRHLHPEMGATGTWTTPISFAAPGVYRVFADFAVGGEQRTLASDVLVSGGEFEARPFPAPEPVDTTAGYRLRLRAGDLHAGEPSPLAFDVSRGGEGVDDLAPYLGAKGHLVALREGDLAFLHVHPEEGGAAEEIAFVATFPTAGRYRLYLQFRHEGIVRTAEFTVEVAE